MSTPAARLWLQLTPFLFVVLWSTGFIGAKLGLPYAEPFTFLALRMGIAGGLLGVFAWLTRAPWPRSWVQIAHLASAGLLVHALHLGGVFSAIGLGLPAGIAALIMGLQPLLTAVVVGRVLGEQVTTRQWLGLILGQLGMVLVLENRFHSGLISLAGLLSVRLGLLALTAGTLYQKRFCSQMDLRSGGAIQYAFSAVFLALLASLTETMQVSWSGEFIFALTWLVLVLSVGAVGLLYSMIRYGAAARIASLFYLSPPFAVLFAYLLFDELLGPTALAGMAIVAIGVALVNFPARRS